MIKEETVDVGVLWRCIECGHSSKRKDNLAIHIESKHIATDGFNCEYCGKFCPSKNALQSHVSRYHRTL